jgi:prolipoprotein diacylglyceryltransferase
VFPILFSIGPFKLYSLALVAFIGFFAGLFVVWKRGRELHFEEKELFDSIFVVLFWSFITARIGYVALHAPDYWSNLPGIVNFIGHPGWYFPAGLVGAGLATFFESKKNKWDVYQVMDLFVTGVVIAQAILSVGTLLAGIGYGLKTTSIIGLPFAGVYDKRYPVQVWEMISYGICFGYLWWVEGVYRTFSWYKRHRSQAETGFLVSMYFIWLGGINFVSSLFRTPEMVVGVIRFDLIVSTLGVVGGLWILFYRSGITIGDIWDRLLSYFGLGKPQHQKIKERLENIRDLLDE